LRNPSNFYKQLNIDRRSVVGSIRIVMAAVFVFFLAQLAFAQEAGLFDELDTIYPDSSGVSGADRMAVDTARGVPAGVLVMISELPAGAEVVWRIETGDHPVAAARAFRLIDVPVEQNTGLSSRTEIFDKKPNPHVIRKAPFRIFEALEPVGRTVRAGDGGVLALRFEVPVASDAPVGTSVYGVNLESGDWRCTLCWELTVHAVTVPPSGPHSPGYTNWFSPDLIAERHGIEPWSEAFFEMLGQYADLMARGRQNTFWIRWGDFVTVDESGKVSVNVARLERYGRIFRERGFTIVEGGHLAHRHKGDWSSPRLDVQLTGRDTSSDAGRADVGAILDAVSAALDETGLLEGAVYLQHITDEPTDTNAESYQALAAQVRAHMPGVKIFEATMSRALVGAVDHWCPQVQKYQQHRDFFEERKKAGDAVWVYTCLVPGGPWLNRLLDQERLRQVYVGWSLVKYDLAGFLHWGLNHYRKGIDPFEQSVVPHGNGPPNYLPAGDSHVVYPGKEGPLSGQRFEAHRIGMEDAELLRIASAHDPTKAGGLMDKVFRAFDDYETDLAVYRAAKGELLRMAASCSAKRLRVLTYNIHHGEGMDGKFDYDRLAAVIACAKPDLVALQEVDRGTRRAGGVDQPALLAEKLGMYQAFGEAMPYSGGQYGEAILSRYPFESVTTHKLSCASGQEPRAALAVSVKPWGENSPAIQFTGTHLCHQSAATRLRQAAEIDAALADWEGPALLAGDFNFGPDTAPYLLLAEKWSDAARLKSVETPTMGAHKAPEERRLRIDYIWIRPSRGLKVISVDVIEEPLASDHLPVLVVVEESLPEQSLPE